MQDIEYLGRIINVDYLLTGENALTMVEAADRGNRLSEQRVVVQKSSQCIKDMKLYCFNAPKETPLLPFFNQNTADPNKAPEGLLKFCDYILLVQHEKGLFVFLLEMKRGTTEGADEQLEASKVFFEFVLKSAERIKKENGHNDFSSEKIFFRQIVLQDNCSNKRLTKPKDIRDLTSEDLEKPILVKCSTTFRPMDYCR